MNGDGLANGMIPPAISANVFRALRSVPFRWYFAGQIASASGTFLQQTAVGWLVLELTGSAGALGMVLAAGGLPPLLFGPWGGAIADRMNLRRLLITTQTLLGLFAATLWVAAMLGRANVVVVILVTAASGLVLVVDAPTRQAFIASLVSADDLPSAVSLNGVVMNTARVVGPAIAGLLIIAAGTTPCFAVNAASYVVIIVTLLFIRPLAARDGRRGTGGVRAGLAYAARHRRLWLPLAMMSVIGLLAFNFLVVLPVFARDTFNGNGGTYGLMSTLLGVGAVVGSLLAGLVRQPARRHLVMTANAFGVTLLATAAAPTLLLANIALLVTGAAAFSFVTLCAAMLQLNSIRVYRGRVMALWVYVFIGTTPVGSVITGWVIDAAGARAALLMGATSCLTTAFAAACLRGEPPPPGSAFRPQE